jgi:hypothetical protein
MALSAADENDLKGLINQSNLDSELKRVLTKFIDVLATKNVVAGDLTAGVTGTLGLTVAPTCKNGLIVSLGS